MRARTEKAARGRASAPSGGDYISGKGRRVNPTALPAALSASGAGIAAARGRPGPAVPGRRLPLLPRPPHPLQPDHRHQAFQRYEPLVHEPIDHIHLLEGAAAREDDRMRAV